MNNLQPIQSQPLTAPERHLQMASGRSKLAVLDPSNPGQTIRLSLREKTMVDAFLVTQTYEGTARALREKFGGKTTYRLVKKWLDRDHVQRYMQDRLLDTAYCNSMTKEKWLRQAQEYRDGTLESNASTAFMHKLIGQAMGYLTESSVFKAENMQINFVQGDGSK